MKKEEYLSALREKLTGLPPAEIEDRVAFYEEMIEGRMAEGVPEELAITALGPVDVVAKKMMGEIPLATLMKDKVKKKDGSKTGMILFLILGFPIWFPLLTAFLAMLFSLNIVLWALVISFYAVAAALVISTFAGIFATTVYATAGNVPGALFYGGAALVCLGVGILMFVLSTALAKGAAKLTGKMWEGLKRALVGKGAKA